MNPADFTNMPEFMDTGWILKDSQFQELTSKNPDCRKPYKVGGEGGMAF